MTRNLVVLAAIAIVSAALAGCAGESAVMKSDIPQLKKLLDQPNHGGANLDRLMNLAEAYDCPMCVQELVNAGAQVTNHLLALAAVNGHSQLAQILLEHGADASGAKVIIRGLPGASAQEAQAGVDLLDSLDRSKMAQAVSSPQVVAVHQQIRSFGALNPSFHEVENSNDYALIVGVEKYTDLPAATYAEADAESAKEFVRALGVPERNVVILTGARATRAGLAKQLEGWLTNNVNENSTVYFYYSGHGAPDPKDGAAYLVPIDGDPQYLDQTAYPLKRLYEKLNALKAKRVVVMLDSCFSGAGGRSVLAKGTRPLVNNIDTGYSSVDGKIAVLTASGANQTSGTNDEKGHGLFTYYLFSGLNGAAEDSSGRVTLQSLYDYLKPKVMDDARRANGDQTPELKADPAASATVLREK